MISATTASILNDLIGSSGVTIKGTSFRAHPVYVGSIRELTAVRELENLRLAYLFMAGDSNAYPQYYVVAAKDYHEAKKVWREMYVSENCDDVKYA